MSFISRVFQSRRVATSIAPRLSPLGVLGLTIVLSAGSLFSFIPRASAIETIELQYQDRTLTTTADRIRQYAETGQASEELQNFVGGDTQLAEIVSKLLVEEITLTGDLRDKIRQDLQKSSIGQFVLLQLNKLIVGSDDLSNLQAAIQDSLKDDDKISLLEVAQNYSGADEVTINLTEVGAVYTDVKSFVERVVPALEVAREYLQDYVCDCPTADTSTPSESSPAPSSGSDSPTDAPSNSTDTPQSRQGNGGTLAATTSNCHNSLSTAPSAPLASQPIPTQH